MKRGASSGKYLYADAEKKFAVASGDFAPRNVEITSSFQDFLFGRSGEMSVGAQCRAKLVVSENTNLIILCPSAR
jgi:hypothetical protein